MSFLAERGDVAGESYLRKCLADLWDNLPVLLLGNVVFLAFCIPPFVFFFVGDVLLFLWTGCFSAAPAFLGLLSFVGTIVQGQRPSLRSLIIGTLRFYGQGVILGSIGVLSLLGLLSALSPGEEALSGTRVVLLVFSFAGFLFATTLLVHAFPLLALENPPLRKVIVHALFLASKYRIPTAGMVSLGLLCTFLTWWTRLGLLFVLPAVWAVFSCELTVRLLQDRWSERTNP
jgi:hypothetical protein